MAHVCTNTCGHIRKHPGNVSNTLATRSRKFANDESGSLLIFGVYVFVMILMVAGIGIDLMRLERDRAHMQYTMDNAVLAAAALEQTLDPSAVVTDYLTKAGLASHVTGLTVDDSATSRTVSVSSKAKMFTQFMHMTGADSLDLSAFSAAREAVPNVEVSLVVDISQSMSDGNRHTELKTELKDFVSDMVEYNDTGGSETSINIIPFSGQTNPGEEMFEYLETQYFGHTDSDYFPEWAQDVSNITIWLDVDGNGEIDPAIDFSAKIEGYPDNDVEFFNKDDLDEYYQYAVDYVVRLEPSLDASTAAVGATVKGGKKSPATFYSVVTGEEITAPTEWDSPDMELMFTKFYSEVIPNNTAHCIEMTAADFASTSLPTGNTQTPYFMDALIDPATTDWGWCPEDDTAIRYAQENEASMHAFIDSLRLHDGSGNTYAMKWATALLDPTSQPAFSYLSSVGQVPGKFATRPAAWNSNDTEKYIVLISDGSTSAQTRPVNPLDPVNANTELVLRDASESEIISDQFTETSTFLTQCSLAKANGVVIFTIAVDAPEAVDDLEACASSPSHFYDANGQPLSDTLSSISLGMQKLRLIH